MFKALLKALASVRELISSCFRGTRLRIEFHDKVERTDERRERSVFAEFENGIIKKEDDSIKSRPAPRITG